MSGSIRLFVEASLSQGAQIAATPGQAHYLGNVMRRGVGDPVVLFNGVDGEWSAQIVALRKDRAQFAVQALCRPQPMARSGIWLVFAPLKRDATDLVVRQATELGVEALFPVLTEHANTTRINPERLKAIAIEAAEQCERLTVPVLHPLNSLGHVLHHWPHERPLAAALERRPPEDAAPDHTIAPGGLLIGPEGGFSIHEAQMLCKCAFVRPLSLGPLILRAETAVIAGLATLQCQEWQAHIAASGPDQPT